MNNKKGFTIIEITCAVTLILLLAILVVPNLLDMGDGSKEKMYEAKIELALSGAYKYGRAHIDDLSSSCTNVTIGNLIKEGYVSGDDESGYNLLDPDTGESMNNIAICVYYEENEVKVKVN